MYTLPQLTYDYDALEPYIDAQTMELHHSKHHQTYIDKLNAALQNSDHGDQSIEDVIMNLSAIPEDIRTAVRNNGGGHFNHSFFWESMQPNGVGQPDGSLQEMISASFESFERFKELFGKAAAERLGSGWVWLIKNQSSQLEIISTPNQDSPLMDGLHPLLGLDVWEHAYYLKYQNRRPEYVEKWWNVVDWAKVAERL